MCACRTTTWARWPATCRRCAACAGPTRAACWPPAATTTSCWSGTPPPAWVRRLSLRVGRAGYVYQHGRNRIRSIQFQLERTLESRALPYQYVREKWTVCLGFQLIPTGKQCVGFVRENLSSSLSTHHIFPALPMNNRVDSIFPRGKGTGKSDSYS